MLSIDEKDYDLNFLIHFDMLREILIKLSKNQSSLLRDVNSIKKSNRERDYKIMQIEKTLKEQENGQYEEFDQKNGSVEKDEEKKEKREYDSLINNTSSEEEKKVKKEVDSQNINISKDEEDKKEENIKTEENEENEEKKIDENKENKEYKEIEKKEEVNKENSEKKFSSKNNNYPNFIKSNKNNKQLNSLLKETTSRINQLEIYLNNNIKKDFNGFKKDLKNHDLENQSDFKLIDSQINEIFEKLNDYDKKIEDCTVKCASIDILNLIKDNGDGTIDAAKLLFKSLEDKTFKKFDIVDARYKQDSIELMKMKKTVENFTPKLDKVIRDIEQMKENEEQQKEEIINNKKELNEENEKAIRLIEEKNDNILQKLEELKDQIDNNLNQKIKEIETKINLSGKGDDVSSLFKLGLVGDNKMDEEKFQALDKKISDARKKVNDLENSFKIFLNEEIEVLKNDVKELKFKIDKKISKEDLKELYNFHLSDLDEINDLKDQTGIINDEMKKIIKDLQNISARVESINGNVILLQNSQLTGGRGPIIDISKYIDQQRLTDTLRPLLKEIEKIYKEIESLQRTVLEEENNAKLLEKKERVNKLEEDIYSKINDLKVYCNRKFPDKIEMHKTIKQLDVQIKDITGKRTDGDGWLMAKQPLKCFNCASCEANIKNTSPMQEYIPWNKYPQGERIYRMGQGFSHMLQMMTSEFVKTFDHPMESNSNIANINSDNENSQNTKNNKNINSNNNMHSPLYHSSEKSFSGMKINNKEQLKDDVFNFYRTGGKIKLPKMKKYSKKNKDKFEESIPVSDEEKDYIGEKIEKPNPVNTESPKIMRITKKKLQNPFNMSGFSPKYGTTIEYGYQRKDIFESTNKGKVNKK